MIFKVAIVALAIVFACMIVWLHRLLDKIDRLQREKAERDRALDVARENAAEFARWVLLVDRSGGEVANVTLERALAAVAWADAREARQRMNQP